MFTVRTRLISYSEWISQFDVLTSSDQVRVHALVEKLNSDEHFIVIVNALDASDPAVLLTLKALESQIYRTFSCVLLCRKNYSCNYNFYARVFKSDELISGLDSLNAEIAEPRNKRWIIYINAGDLLSPLTFVWLVHSIANHPESTLIYFDDDIVDQEGRRKFPRLKPDWSLTHLRATHYLGNAVAIRGSALSDTGGIDESVCSNGMFDKILQVIDIKDENVVHLPAVLLHQGSGGDTRASAWEMHAVQRHLVRRGIPASVSPTLSGCRRVRHQLPASLPLVSIIVPTRDAVDILRRCVDSVLFKTTYQRFEILVVDNQSRDAAALAYLQQLEKRPSVRVLRYDKPFNYSAINNFAVSEACGEFLCLLNNDTEVITPDWLDEMVGHLLQDQVGVVGAKLFYPDGRVQHGGDTVGPGGCANHLHNGIARDDPGYCNRAVVAQDLSAVTAACLLTRRDLYLELGGLDARWLRVAFNDVDYCLRARAAGWRVVWTPHAELYHHESASRGKNENWRKKVQSELEVFVMRWRWRHVMRSDPFYNPNLNYRKADFTLGLSPRVRKPWT